MPELPEVQTTVNGINKYAPGLLIKDVWTDYRSAFHKGNDNIKDPVYFTYFKNSVIGTKILKAERRGKNILIHLSNKHTIIIHMKMTGHVMYGAYENRQNIWTAIHPGPLRDDPFNKFIHFVVVLSNNKHLVLSDMRKFAKVTLVETHKLHESSHLAKHGPEPLDSSFTVTKLKEQLQSKPNGKIKQVLMNPEVISGIGNIYSDEILWSIGIHPLTPVKDIKDTTWSKMYGSMKKVLHKGIDFGGDSMSDYRNILGERGTFQGEHNAYRKTGEKCQKTGCKGVITRVKIGGRSAHFCNLHQKLKK